MQRGVRMMDAMTRSFRHIFALSILPAREVARTPIVLLLAAASVVATLVVPLALAFQFGDTGQRLARDGGLALQLTLGIILCACTASAVIRTERESGVAAMLLTKPVTRHWYLLSRFFALAAVAILFSSITTPATLLAHRAAEAFDPNHGYVTDVTAALAGLLCIPLACGIAGIQNWRRRSSFHAVALGALPPLLWTACLLIGFFTRSGAPTLRYAPLLDPRILLAALSLLGALLVFCALALTVGLFLPPVSTVAICMITLFGGLAAGTRSVRPAGRNLVFSLLPNWNLFWPADALDHAFADLALHVLWPFAYGSLLTIGILAIGIRLTHRLEITQ